MKKEKNPIAVDKHLTVFGGTAFKKCAHCAGCAAKLNPDGTMNCSNAGSSPVAVTSVQAARCDGKKPFISPASNKRPHQHHKIHSIFARVAERHSQQLAA